MEIPGYIACLFIGMILGALGGGGSILTLPVLVYCFRLSPPDATVYSLFIVGLSAFVGVVRSWQNDLVEKKLAFYFILPSVVTVWISRSYIMPCIPAKIYLGNTAVSTSKCFMLVFGILMVAAASTMLRRRQSKTTTQQLHIDRSILKKLAPAGAGVGLLTGVLGAGGGFLIVPLLSSWLRMPIKKATTVSLVIIAINASTGFVSSFNSAGINWHLFVVSAMLASSGMIIGMRIASRCKDHILKSVFGFFVLAIAAIIFFCELFIL